MYVYMVCSLPLRLGVPCCVDNNMFDSIHAMPSTHWYGHLHDLGSNLELRLPEMFNVSCVAEM